MVSVSFDSLKPGEILLDVHYEQAGNTTARRQGVCPVCVVSVDMEARTAMCRWNGNEARKYYESQFRALRRVAPEWVKSDPFRGASCHHCRKRKSEGHAPDCDHPRAIRARKAAK